MRPFPPLEIDLFLLNLNPQLLAIRGQFDPAILVCAQQGVSLDGLQGLGGRQPLPIPGGEAEQDDLRAQVGDPLWRVGGRVAAIGQQQGGHRADLPAIP